MSSTYIYEHELQRIIKQLENIIPTTINGTKINCDFSITNAADSLENYCDIGKIYTDDPLNTFVYLNIENPEQRIFVTPIINGKIERNIEQPLLTVHTLQNPAYQAEFKKAFTKLIEGTFNLSSNNATPNSFELNIKMGNDAVQTPEDIVPLLNEVAETIANGGTSQIIMDYNGNKVGSWEFKN